MQLTKDSIDNLRGYIANNEVVYQVCDELIEVANNSNPDNRDLLLAYNNQASKVMVLYKGSTMLHEGFEDIDNWATEDDSLFFMETSGVVICIPSKLAKQSQIIKEHEF